MSIGIKGASSVRRALGVLLAFGAINAFAGGYYGLSGAQGVPVDWLDGSPFRSYFIPSLILLTVVGGSFLTAAVAVFACLRCARPAALAAAAIVTGWLAAQVAIIGYVSWMQPTTAVAAFAIFLLAWILPSGAAYAWPRSAPRRACVMHPDPATIRRPPAGFAATAREKSRDPGNHMLPLDRNQRGGPMPVLELGAHMTVRPGQLEGFKKQAAECIRITKEKDTHTLRYDWFLSLDETECEVREASTGPEGLIEHNRHILEARTALFRDYADNHFMTVYGEVSEPLLNLLKAHAAGYKWFSFVQGLEPAAVVPSQFLVATGEAKPV